LSDLELNGNSVIASEFYLYTAADLCVLDPKTLEEIVSSEDLVLESEDSLLAIIVELGSDYSGLLRYMLVGLLGEAGAKQFFTEIDFCWITKDVWKGLGFIVNKAEPDYDAVKRKRFRKRDES
jgi:hypothetical protein